GIRTTRAQRTDNPDDLLQQEMIRRGTYGPAAQQTLDDVLRLQKNDIQFAAIGSPSGPGNAAARRGLVPISEKLAPARTFMDQRPDILGHGVQRGFDQSVKSAKAFERAAWEKVPPLIAGVDAKRNLPDVMRKAIGAIDVDPTLHPGTNKMLKQLIEFQSGKTPKGDVTEWLGQQAVTSVDEMRRKLLSGISSAAPGADKATAQRVYTGYLGWMREAAEKKLLKGDADGAGKLLAAMKATREARTLMTGRIKAGTVATKATPILEKLKNADSGEDALLALIGRSSVGSSMPAGAMAGLVGYKKLLDRFGGKAGKWAWDDVRLAYWNRMVTDKAGQMLSPGMLAKNIRESLNQRQSLMRTFYSQQEIDLMGKFANSMQAINNPIKTNPSQTGFTVMRFFPKAVRETLGSIAQREKFVKGNIIKGNILRFLAQYIKVFDKPAGTVVARDAVSQQMRSRVTPSLAGYATGPAGAANVFRRDEKKPRNALMKP
ncbi:MAG: hypothetical protein OEL78_05530, partial [Hyphomicrobiales bacterium]|nr:hypothetical protein [Hyphomicrobiales bacterium]